MAEEEEDGGEDIPAWFMTYSDVITLLMTFFILLLTFASTEPEQYERVQMSIMGSDSATGVAGLEHTKMDLDSSFKRFRPRAARIAIHGAEMPPMMQDAATEPSGNGLTAPDKKQAKIDVMKAYSTKIPIQTVSVDGKTLTQWGKDFSGTLSTQLRRLPVHCAVEFSSDLGRDAGLLFFEILTQREGVRPGQVACSYTPDVSSDMMRITIERYEQNADGR